MSDLKLYVVNAEILPKVYERVAKAKELLRTHEADTIHQACEIAKVSRSAFYKYKDCIFDYEKHGNEGIIVLFMLLSHMPGVLSDVINKIASVKANIITINQNIPVLDTAALTASIDIKSMDITPDQLVHLLLECRGCKRVELIGIK